MDEKLRRVRVKWVLTNVDTGEHFEGVAYSIASAHKAWVKAVRDFISVGTRFSVVYFDSNNCSLGSGFYELTPTGIDVVGDELDHKIYTQGCWYDFDTRAYNNKLLLGSRFASQFDKKGLDIFDETSNVFEV